MILESVGGKTLKQAGIVNVIVSVVNCRFFILVRNEFLEEEGVEYTRYKGSSLRYRDGEIVCLSKGQ